MSNQNKFEQRLRQKMQGYSATPSGKVWSGIESQLDKGSKWPIGWLAGWRPKAAVGGLLLAAALGWYLLPIDNNESIVLKDFILAEKQSQNLTPIEDLNSRNGAEVRESEQSNNLYHSSQENLPATQSSHTTEDAATLIVEDDHSSESEYKYQPSSNSQTEVGNEKDHNPAHNNLSQANKRNKTHQTDEAISQNPAANATATTALKADLTITASSAEDHLADNTIQTDQGNSLPEQEHSSYELVDSRIEAEQLLTEPYTLEPGPSIDPALTLALAQASPKYFISPYAEGGAFMNAWDVNSLSEDDKEFIRVNENINQTGYFTGAGVHVGVALSKRVSLNTGLGYLYSSNEIQFEPLTIIGSDTIALSSPPIESSAQGFDESGETYSENKALQENDPYVLNQRIIEGDQESYTNELAWINIPISLTYTQPLGGSKLSVGLSAGLDYQILVFAKSYSLEYDQSGFFKTDNGNKHEFYQNSLAYNVSPFVQYRMGPLASLRFSMLYRKLASSIIKNEFWLQQRPQNLGLRLSLVHKFY